MQSQLEETIITEDLEDDVSSEISKDMTQAHRRGRSEAARAKRQSVKSVIETKITNAWAKARRDRKNK